MLLDGLHSSRKALVLNDPGPDCEQDDLTLEELANILARSAAQPPPAEHVTPAREADIDLPKIITFPYSRHSSYAELRDLVRVFKPMDIYPCTVNKADWHEGEFAHNSMPESLSPLSHNGIHLGISLIDVFFYRCKYESFIRGSLLWKCLPPRPGNARKSSGSLSR
jgi:hypothetical protein